MTMRKAKLVVTGGNESLVHAVTMLNDKVFALAQQYSVSEYRLHTPAHTVHVIVHDDWSLWASAAAYTLHDYIVDLGMANRTHCGKAVLWTLAHELTHCYLGPDFSDRYTAAVVQYPHDVHPWEKVADNIASQVVDFDRKRLNKALTWKARQ